MSRDLPHRGPRKRASASPRSKWPILFARNVILWMIPVAAIWLLATPVYNLFLTRATENAVRLTEGTAVTRLQIRDTHYFVVTRTDIPSSKGWLYSVRVTDTHFPILMLGAFFLAVPGIPWRKKLENLSWALLVMIFFHILSLFFWVKFAYATQLGSWSAENYGALAQNFWGLSKHLLDLPFKFAMPLVLWIAFYFRHLLPRR